MSSQHARRNTLIYYLCRVYSILPPRLNRSSRTFQSYKCIGDDECLQDKAGELSDAQSPTAEPFRLWMFVLLPHPSPEDQYAMTDSAYMLSSPDKSFVASKQSPK
jgi:hypothetical protein